MLAAQNITHLLQLINNNSNSLLELKCAVAIATNIGALLQDNRVLVNTLRTHGNNLQAEVNTLTQSAQTLQFNLNTVQSNFDDLQFEYNNMVKEHTAEIAGARKVFAEMDLGSLGRKKRSQPHPDPQFTSIDSKLLSPFICDLHKNLEVNTDWWDSDCLRIFYIVSCFPAGSVAKKMVDSGFKTDGSMVYKTVKDVIDLLKQSFDNADEKSTAQQELKMCFQEH